MTDGPVQSQPGLRVSAKGPVESLAGQALSVLAGKRKPRSGRPLLIDFEAALLGDGETWRAQLGALLNEAGVGSDQLIDDVIPSLARSLGAKWVDDTLGFAQVSIGSARLQGLVRETSIGLFPAEVAAGAPDVAVVVPEHEHHTLGATVLASFLRRSGVSVRLMLGRSDADILDDLTTHHLDAILISCASSGALPGLRVFIDRCRRKTAGRVPIVVGGPVMDLSETVLPDTGADIASSDLSEVFGLCRLRLPSPAAGSMVEAE